MMVSQIVLRPKRRYDSRGRRARGSRRTDAKWGRTLALFDLLGIRKRVHCIHVTISDEAKAKIDARADALGVCASGLAALLIEQAVRASS